MEDISEVVPTEPVLTLNCRFCQFHALTNDALFKHETGHFKPKPGTYNCMQCSKVFTDSYRFRSHMYTQHSTVCLICQICQKSYRSRNSLANHKRSHRVHNKNNSL